jgi:integrase
VAQATPGAGAFLYTIVSSFLGYAEAMGWIETYPLPRRGRSLIAPHVPARTRVLDDHEWLAVWHAAEREPVKLRAFTRLLILTACRVSEVANISTGEIVADGTIWVIPAERTKNSREHILPLGQLAQRELRLVWPPDTGALGPAWMLLGRSPTQGFTGNGKLLRRLFGASGTAGWTWHDLRRTARTGMAYLKVPEADAEAALNHVTGRSKLIATYDHSGPSASAITALRVWQGYVADVVEGRRPPGDAEAQHREALPEDLRYRSKPKFVARKKAKPGRKAPVLAQGADRVDQPHQGEDSGQTDQLPEATPEAVQASEDEEICGVAG